MADTTSYPGEAKLPHLFQPVLFGTLRSPNRVKYGACCVSNYNSRDGTITRRELARTKIIAGTARSMGVTVEGL